MADWYVYIMSNKADTLYTGITDDLPKRAQQHKDRTYNNAFTARYTFNRLVYFESASDQKSAAIRERRIKNWPRAKRVALIESINPNWDDLSTRFDLAHLLQ
ncbi:MAG TPA: GIY-YIG nuclease family protein [Thermoanaerobaculia bacterium]